MELIRRIYVAGPFRGPSSWRIEKNIRVAEETGLLLAKQGWYPIIPHTMYRNFQGELPDEFWLQATKDLLRVCEALVLCQGWQRSEESRDEFEVAYKRGLPMYQFKEGLIIDQDKGKTILLKDFKPFEDSKRARNGRMNGRLKRDSRSILEQP